MKKARFAALTFCFTAFMSASAAARESAALTGDELVVGGQVGLCGGKIAISQRAEPKTLNPVLAFDGSSREIIGLINADLIHINRGTQKTEPALARDWRVSADGRRYTINLRRGLRFSDGKPFDADDVLFTFEVYLDEKVHSSQRDLLVIAGKPIQVRKIDAFTLEFDLQQPYAAGDRLFDSIFILPRHLLKEAYEAGKLNEKWNLMTPGSEVAGLGPYRIREYVAGQHITLERNPYYWKVNAERNRLPYLDAITSVFTGNADSEAMRFQLGEVDVVSRLSASNFTALQKHGQGRAFRLYDAGPSLEYNFLFFNLNDVKSAPHSSVARDQSWFRQLEFRKAVSAAIDRESIARLAYSGRARPLSTHVTPGNKLWLDRDIPAPTHSVETARRILKATKFSWSQSGRLVDQGGNPVTFSLLFNAANPQHTEVATLLQADLKETGIDVKVIPLEFRDLLNRIFKTHEYEAAIMTLADGDADPNSDMNVLMSTGSAHVWDLTSQRARMPWEKEIDQLMQQQMTTLDTVKRKHMYDRVQELISENLPFIALVSPDVLVGAAERIRNFHPAVLSNYTLWNVEQLFTEH